MAATRKHKIAVIGSGNWGCTIAKIVAENTAERPDLFEPVVQMWVFEEDVVPPERLDAAAAAAGKKQKLTHIINTHHENVRYLPNIRLPTNLVANPSLVDTARDATVLIFNLPHQFIGNVCTQLHGAILPYARGISCIKGVNVADDGISLFSEWIGDALAIYCGSLSGANLANEIAQEKWSETTIAYDPPPVDHSENPTAEDRRSASRSSSISTGGGEGSGAAAASPAEAHARDIRHRDAKGQASKTRLTPLPADFPPLDHNTLLALFQRSYFHVSTVTDVAGVSLSGALKNIVALAAGFVEGRGWGDNAKAAVMRVGLMEMVQFGKEFFAETVQTTTFTEESAGVADLITSCMGGRNFRCAKLSIERGVPVDEVERTELNGQKLQGTTTAHEVSSFLRARGAEGRYPLFTAVEGILVGRHKVDDIPRLVARSAHNIEHGAAGPVPVQGKL